MIESEQAFRAAAVARVAEEIALAARTAPKGKGLDLLEIIILSGDEIRKLSEKMSEIGKREDHQTFIRDAQNIRAAQAIVVIGTRMKTVGLKYCSFCGYASCAENEKNNGICVFNAGDLGIAVGSAVSAAADHRLDNRVMYTIGKAACDMGLLGDEVKIAFGIPLSVSAKNPFFDRK